MPESLFRTSPEPSLIIDPSLDSNAAGNCVLLISATEQFVQLALVERKTLKVLAIEKVRMQFAADQQYLQKMHAASQLIKKYPFSGVKFVVYNEQYTFVPDSLFKPGEEYKFYRLNFHSDLSSIVQVASIPKFGTFCLYGMNPKFNDEINSIFPESKVYHFSEILLNNRFLNMRNDAGKVMNLNVREHVLDIIVTSGKKLILMNSFAWQTIEDILYYALFVSEQLGLNPEQNRLIISGNVERSSALYKLLENYFSEISFDELPGLKTGYGLEEIPFALNPVIYGLSLCE